MLLNDETVRKYLEGQNVGSDLIGEVLAFRNAYDNDEKAESRITAPEVFFQGGKVLQAALSALLEGENLLLSGAKATGKNVLCQTLSCILNRPEYDVSLNISTDSASMIGTDTFYDNTVHFRPGPIYRCAQYGGIGVLDEINMAKNEAVSVLHATLDHRRSIDVPGYEKIMLHPACRFIGTMNYGYAGTRELNEALVSRFMVIDMLPLEKPMIMDLLKGYFPDLSVMALEQFSGVFEDLQLKAGNGEISSKSLDMRGFVSAIHTMKRGLDPIEAMRMGVINKSFDVFEKEIIEDAVRTRIPSSWDRSDIFE